MLRSDQRLSVQSYWSRMNVILLLEFQQRNTDSLKLLQDCILMVSHLKMIGWLLFHQQTLAEMVFCCMPGVEQIRFSRRQFQAASEPNGLAALWRIPAHAKRSAKKWGGDVSPFFLCGFYGSLVVHLELFCASLGVAWFLHTVGLWRVDLTASFSLQKAQERYLLGWFWPTATSWVKPGPRLALSFPGATFFLFFWSFFSQADVWPVWPDKGMVFGPLFTGKSSASGNMKTGNNKHTANITWKSFLRKMNSQPKTMEPKKQQHPNQSLKNNHSHRTKETKKG